MKRILAFTLVAILVVSTAGCADDGDYSARFLRYEVLQDGTRVAVVSPIAIGSDDTQIAYCGINDLRSGDEVVVRWVGRSWETPQWRPEREIIRRR